MNDSKAITIILNSKLLDIDFYKNEYSIQSSNKENIIEHYYYHGAKQGYNPNSCFNTEWYLEKNPDVAKAKMNPLVHYIKYGEKEARWPCPYFDPKWYKEKYKPRLWRKTALYHYLKKGKNNYYSPLSVIDVQYYLQENPDIQNAGIDPVEHFIEVGSKEGRTARSEEIDSLQTPIIKTGSSRIKKLKKKFV